MSEIEGLHSVESEVKPTEIDVDEYYKPAYDVGFATDEGQRICEELETSEEIGDAFRKIGVASGLVDTARQQWQTYHGGSEMQGDNVRFGLMRRHTELAGGGKPLDYNNLIVWATNKKYSKKVKYYI